MQEIICPHCNLPKRCDAAGMQRHIDEDCDGYRQFDYGRRETKEAIRAKIAAKFQERTAAIIEADIIALVKNDSIPKKVFAKICANAKNFAAVEAAKITAEALKSTNVRVKNHFTLQLEKIRADQW